jgi:hypothetical protein
MIQNRRLMVSVMILIVFSVKSLTAAYVFPASDPTKSSNTAVNEVTEEGQSVNTNKDKPLLFAVYYTWYHDADHPTDPYGHWSYESSQDNERALAAQREGEPPPSSAARPIAGPDFYDSADPEVAEWHVELASAAGIDAFLVDWWGRHNDLDKNIEQGILTAAEEKGFKIALLDERAQFHNDFEWYKRSVVDALSRFIDKPVYLYIDGKPVYYLYQVATDPSLTPAKFVELKNYVESEVGPVYWIVDKIAHDPVAAAVGDTNHVKRIPEEWLNTEGIDAFTFYSTFSNFRAHLYDQLIGKYTYMTQLAHGAGKKMMLPVHPGHNNSYFREDGDYYIMPRRDGETLRDYLRAAEDAGADYIMVTSWNEWPETTIVEPSSTWDDPFLYLRILAEWKGKEFKLPGTD